MRGFVYIIHARGTNRYKIGRTAKSVEDRLSDLQTGSPHELTVIECREFADSANVEQMLHEMFAKHRGSGEWFEFDDVGLAVECLRVWASGKTFNHFRGQYPWTIKTANEAHDFMGMLAYQTQIKILRDMVIEMVVRMHELEQAAMNRDSKIFSLERELLLANAGINRLNGFSEGEEPTELRVILEME